MRKILAVLIMIVLFVSISTSCIKINGGGSSGSNNTPSQNTDGDALTGDGSIHAEEADGAVIVRKAAEPTDFYGSWTGTSEKAVQLYGNVDININSDGTWTGNITETDLEGKWSKSGGGLHLESELFSFDLTFNDAGKLIMVESGGGPDLYTVLHR